MHAIRREAGATPHCPPKSAFTLIELLVVIGIIVLLAALLFPAFSKVKSQARSTTCKNRLSQTGRTMAMYLGDYPRYPPQWSKGQSFQTETWTDKLQPYSSLNWTNIEWHCPSYIASGGIVEWVKPPDTGGKFVHRSSYAYNLRGFAGAWGEFGLGLVPERTTREAEISAPSQMFTVADARAYKYRWLTGLAGQPFMFPWHWADQETAPPHSEAYNILFADQHVAPVKRKDYLFPPRAAQHWNRDNQLHPEVWLPTNNWAVLN